MNANRRGAYIVIQTSADGTLMETYKGADLKSALWHHVYNRPPDIVHSIVVASRLGFVQTIGEWHVTPHHELPRLQPEV